MFHTSALDGVFEHAHDLDGVPVLVDEMRAQPV